MSLLRGFDIFGRKKQTDPGVICSIGSPVRGQIEESGSGGEPRIVIYPEEEKIYAPAAGKVTGICPLGNGFIFRTDEGAELDIRVGNSENELLGRYYRPRVLKNEIVAEGRLLLEFDRTGLAGEGIYPRVIVSAKRSFCGENILPVPEGQPVAVGEDIFRIYQYSERVAMYPVSE